MSASRVADALLTLTRGPRLPIPRSYDTRGRQSTRGTHWAQEDSLGQRSAFEPRPRSPLLRIRDIQEGDEGVYRCRADFKATPTLNARVNLTVIGEYRVRLVISGVSGRS